ncbi:MAG: hypothetical protein ABMA14_10395 [Hyphomonadaceae bacterium]
MADAKLVLPKDPVVAQSYLDHQKKEKGLIGAMIGSRDHAPYSLTFVALLIVGGLLLATFLTPMQGVDKAAVIPALLSALTGIIGFVFGSRTNKD